MMFNVIWSIEYQHDLKLVVLAAVICALGSLVAFRLFDRGIRDRGVLNLGWQFMAAAAAGSSIWSAHFVAMLAYKSGAAEYFDPVLTIMSLLIAICSAFVGFAIAGSPIRLGAPAGGLLIGLGAAAMHYLGISAYHVDGIINSDPQYVIASIVISILAAVSALIIARHPDIKAKTTKAAIVFVGGIVGLHFTGMTALTVTPLVLRGGYLSPSSYNDMALALAITVACLVIAGTGLTTFIIDHRTHLDSDRKLQDLALYDVLTGLPNRQNFTNRLEEVFELSAREGDIFSYICIDLDHFKEINDMLGHSAGDAVLSVIGERLKSLSDRNFLFAHIGGDEFAAICKACDKQRLVESMINIMNAVTWPIELENGEEVSVGVSLGAAFYPSDATEVQELINKADFAMCRAKADPSRSVYFYDAGMDEVVRSRKALTADLCKAIDHNELELYCQVQGSVATGKVCGFEVLLRWNHPRRGYISPTEFIPLAEESGLILDIGKWVLQTACVQAANWPVGYKIAVNLSPIQLSDQTLPELVRATLEQSGLPASRLELELTESAIVENREQALAIISRIKDLGVTIALDDFGTGYSSLETLRSFPFDKIKLDRSFMTEIEDSPQACAIVRAVLALGKCLNIPVLAEGVETKHQLDILNSEGCDAAQGYYFGRPALLSQVVADFSSADDIANQNVSALRKVLEIDSSFSQATDDKSEQLPATTSEAVISHR